MIKYTYVAVDILHTHIHHKLLIYFISTKYEIKFVLTLFYKLIKCNLAHHLHLSQFGHRQVLSY